MPLQSLPIELCDRIANHIDAARPIGLSNFARDRDKHTLFQLALTSKYWLDVSRRSHFSVLLLKTAGKILTFLELIRDGPCTFTRTVQKVIFGDFVPNDGGWASTTFGHATQGWFGDFLDLDPIIAVFPQLRAIQFSCLEQVSIPLMRDLHDIRISLSEQYHSDHIPTSRITILTLRIEFFNGSGELYDFIHGFTALDSLALYAITNQLLETIPYYLPESVKALKLVEDPPCVNHGAPFRHLRDNSIMWPRRENVRLHQTLYYNFGCVESLSSIPFLSRMSHHTDLLVVAYPLEVNASVNGDPPKLATEIKSGEAAIAIIDEAREIVWSTTDGNGEELTNFDIRCLDFEGDPETARRVFTPQGWQTKDPHILFDRDSDDSDSEAEDGDSESSY